MQARVPHLLVAAVCAAMVAACGGTASKAPPKPDAGGNSATGTTGSSGICTDDTQCGAGAFCINGHCGTCNSVTHPQQCPAGTFCASNGDCAVVTGSTTGSSGTSSSTTGTTGSSGGACTHRSDCPNAQACLDLADGGGECGAPAPDAGCDSNDQCIKAYICQSHDCVYGC